MSPANQSLHAASARPPRADAGRNRRSILGAAARLFNEHGSDVPLDQVAKSAHVANATLYRHFPTRADLLIAVYADEVVVLNTLSRRLKKGAGH